MSGAASWRSRSCHRLTAGPRPVVVRALLLLLPAGMLSFLNSPKKILEAASLMPVVCVTVTA
jgi:hypothetical protein